ncbi:MAG: hypothetical protein DME26_09800 [Verrucomicrobia bacterium]|nr:MAG: hypothetical protein DME26_09800 [Verrucomicrobiota bacterium]
MNSATISTKGQLVIPQRFRKALHLEPWREGSFSLEGKKLILQREQPKRARGLFAASSAGPSWSPRRRRRRP